MRGTKYFLATPLLAAVLLGGLAGKTGSAGNDIMAKTIMAMGGIATDRIAAHVMAADLTLGDPAAPAAIHALLGGEPMARLAILPPMKPGLAPMMPGLAPKGPGLPRVVAHGRAAGQRADEGAARQQDGTPLPRVVTAARPQPKVLRAPAGDGGAPDPHQIDARDIDTHVVELARLHDVPLKLARAIVHVESTGNPRAVGASGEIGLMQIMPATARMMGFAGDMAELFDPRTNLDYGLRYLARAHVLADGDLCGTVLRYNAGHGATRMNAVSARYCEKVRAFLAKDLDRDGAVRLAAN